jgi:hypothetical protein
VRPRTRTAAPRKAPTSAVQTDPVTPAAKPAASSAR